MPDQEFELYPVGKDSQSRFPTGQSIIESPSDCSVEDRLEEMKPEVGRLLTSLILRTP